MTAGKLEDIGGRWRLRFTRELAHPQEKVWRAITEPEHMRAWFPQHVSGDWVVGGPLTFSGPEGRGPDFDGEVLAYQPQSLVEFRWGTDVIRLELAGRPDGCTLTLLDTFDELGKAARDAAGWHECLTGSPTTRCLLTSFTPGQRWSEVHPRLCRGVRPRGRRDRPPPGYRPVGSGEASTFWRGGEALRACSQAGGTRPTGLPPPGLSPGYGIRGSPCQTACHIR
jgi:uncharacterized protein YndB with AHSA1/START domain